MTPHIFSPMRPLIAFLLGALVASSAVAEGDRPCSGPNMPSVEVVPRLSQPQFNGNTPTEQLTLAAQVSRPGDADGLTDFHVDADLTLQQSATRGGCPVRSIQAVIKPTRLEVYIAKEVSPSTCRFRAVYEHELKHVMLAQRAIDRSAAPLRKRLAAAVAELSAEASRDVDSLRAALAPVVAAQLRVLIAEYSEGNMELDSPEEAMRLQRKCEAPQVFVGGQVFDEAPRVAGR